MMKLPHLLFVAASVGAVGFAACDAPAPPDTSVAPATEPGAEAPVETLADVVADTLAEIIRDPDAYSRARRLGTFIPTLGPTAVPAVRDVLSNLLLDSRGVEIELLVRFWATHEPQAAAEWANTQSPLDYRDAAVYAALSTWAALDPQRATESTFMWAVDIPERERIVPVALVRGWYARNEPRELQEWISKLPPGILRQRGIAAYVRILIEHEGAEAATTWAESIPAADEGYKLAAFRRTVDLVAVLDPQAAVRWCEIHCDGPNGKNMRSLIARKWVLFDGPAAMAWLSTLRPGNERDLAVRVTYARWARQERDAAIAWMASQTAEELEPWLEPTLPVYARLLTREAPTEAIAWAGRITHEGKRNGVLIDIARSWREADEAAAEAWLEASPLSEEARQAARTPTQGLPHPAL